MYDIIADMFFQLFCMAYGPGLVGLSPLPLHLSMGPFLASYISHLLFPGDLGLL